jgi:hypothetical protein
VDTKAAREWLLANGYRVRPKGRIPSDLLAIYTAKVLKKRGDTGLPSPSTGTGDTLEDNSPKKKVKRTSCGFCTVQAPHKHLYCPGTINQGRMGIWTCLCYENGHI